MKSLYKLLSTIASIWLFAFICLSSEVALAYDGVSLGDSTRIIYHSDEKRISFVAKNDTSESLLFHGLVLNKDRTEYSTDFIISPEITEIKPNSNEFPQLIRLNGKLPEDRESLYYLQGHFIPAKDKDKGDANGLEMSYVIQMKMFYRPNKLKSSFDAIDEVADDVEFELKDSKIKIKNKSPYYLTFNYVLIDDAPIDLPGDPLIEPFGFVEFPVSKEAYKTVTWTFINDGGYSTKPLTRKL